MTPQLKLFHRYAMAFVTIVTGVKDRRRECPAPAYAYAVRRTGSSGPAAYVVRRSKRYL